MQVGGVVAVLSRFEVRRQILIQVAVWDRDLQPIAKTAQIINSEFLHLVSRVATLEMGTEGVALDGLRQNHRRSAGVSGRGSVGGVDLVVVVTPAAQRPNLFISHPRHHGGSAGVFVEEVLSNVSTVFGLEGLEVAVGGLIH